MANRKFTRLHTPSILSFFAINHHPVTSANTFVISCLVLTMALLITLTIQPATPFPHDNLTYSYAIVEIKNGTFVPENVGVYKNATVVWLNRDPHERYLFIGADRMPVLNYGDAYTKNFHEFGMYDCFCGDNRSSRGIVIVR